MEAKFFTDPSDEDIGAQIKEQKKAIETVKSFTKYADMNFSFVALTLNGIESNDIISITWTEIIEIIEQLSLKNKDIIDSKEVIKEAIKRAEGENKSDSKVTYKKYKLNELLSNLQHLISHGKVYVGFTGGVEALNEFDLNSLENRDHYKVSDIKWTENWITIDNIVRRVLELKI